jgi:hypothetical protein
MSQYNLGTRNFVCGELGGIGQYHRVKIGTDGVLMHAGSTEKAIGIALNAGAYGVEITVQFEDRGDPVKLKAIDAISAGNPVYAYGGGYGVSGNNGTGVAFYTALEASTSGAIIEALPRV